MFKVAIRVDSSLVIGSGHVFRCLTLAKELKENGYEVKFYSRPQKGDLNEFVRNSGFELIELKKFAEHKTPLHSSDYQAWLQTPWQEDAKDFITKVQESDLVIVDHYGINAPWQNLIKDALECKILVIDDVERVHDADILIDQTYTESKERYSNSVVKQKLLGAEYALLKKEFHDYRLSLSKTNSFNQKQPQILISMGGMDYNNGTIKVLNALQNIPNSYEFTVIVNNSSATFDKVVRFCGERANFTHLSFVEDMAKCMSEHSIAIGAPGATSWERACLGIPSVVIPLADNQFNIAEVLQNNGAAVIVELGSVDVELPKCLSHILQNYDYFRENSLKICDGLGLPRVVKAIEQELKID